MDLRAAAFCYPIVLLLLLWGGLAPGLSAAQSSPSLQSTFPVSEQVATAGLVASGLSLMIFQEPLVHTLQPSPRITGTLPGEVAVSNALYLGEGKTLLNGVPDFLGDTLFPYGALAFYTGRAAVAGVTGQLQHDILPLHSFLTFAQAYGLNLTLTQTVKILVGRERPYFALNRQPTVERTDDATLSFFSGHSSSSFCLAAFVARDLTDALDQHALPDAPASTRFWLLRVLPSAGLYSVAGLVATSRVVDQQHYLSDVLVGSLVGAVVGNGIYALHYDWAGQPKTRGEKTALRFQATSAGPQMPLYLSWGGQF
ncbi:MAG: phosphatase PAP2 family protein [Myxococcota bacterium]